MTTEELNEYIFAEIVSKYAVSAKTKRLQANPLDGRAAHLHPTLKEDYIDAVRTLRGMRESCLEALRELEASDSNNKNQS